MPHGIASRVTPGHSSASLRKDFVMIAQRGRLLLAGFRFHRGAAREIQFLGSDSYYDEERGGYFYSDHCADADAG